MHVSRGREVVEVSVTHVMSVSSSTDLRLGYKPLGQCDTLIMVCLMLVSVISH